MEEQRPGEYLPVYENERGTYIFNSKDLCMIEHIPELIDAGIDSFKIEGRMKTALYVATVARTYRKAIDDMAQLISDLGDKIQNISDAAGQSAGETAATQDSLKEIRDLMAGLNDQVKTVSDTLTRLSEEV